MKFSIPFIVLLIVACNNVVGKKTTQKKNVLNIENTLNKPNAKKNILEPIDSTFIKENFTFKGRLRDYLKWSDKEGVHIVFTSETGVYHTDFKEAEDTYNQNAEIFCFHYIQKENDYLKKWSIYDFSKDCPMDATAKFGNNNLEFTDLNQNGVPEIWTIYRIACRGDVSPSIMKLIMYEGDKKYKLQGYSEIHLNENEKYGGEITSVVNFKKQKELFVYAKLKWQKNKTDSY